MRNTLFRLWLSTFFGSIIFLPVSAQHSSIPLGGNAWGSRRADGTRAPIDSNGITGWNDASASYTVWFRVSRPGPIDLSFVAAVPGGSSSLSVSISGVRHVVSWHGKNMISRAAGRWAIVDTGYQAVDICGLNKSGPVFADIRRLEVSGAAAATSSSGYGATSSRGDSDTSSRGDSDTSFGGAVTTSSRGDGDTSSRGDSDTLSRGTVTTSSRSTGATSSGRAGSATAGNPGSPLLTFVPNNDGNFFYWGRRGPSVHLVYLHPSGSNAEWFYNEVTVPPGQDIIGSYFMADGFNEGYFGMQVNSATERRILFSVWSPFTTDDPKAIPDSLKILLVRKGDSVHAGVFGDEGSGGQSYLVYPWTAGNTYRFLLRAEPDPTAPAATTAATSTPATTTAPRASMPSTAHNHTRYTAWFFAPESGHWRLVASWDRPATHTWLTHLHSFLENFDPEFGDEQRSASYGNQWVCDSLGHWIPLTRAIFTADNTARKGYRRDYAGGLQGDAFFLRNGGFFDTSTPIDTPFARPLPRAAVPPVALTDLP